MQKPSISQRAKKRQRGGDKRGASIIYLSIKSILNTNTSPHPFHWFFCVSVPSLTFTYLSIFSFFQYLKKTFSTLDITSLIFKYDTTMTSYLFSWLLYLCFNLKRSASHPRMLCCMNCMGLKCCNFWKYFTRDILEYRTLSNLAFQNHRYIHKS